MQKVFKNKAQRCSTPLRTSQEHCTDRIWWKPPYFWNLERSICEWTWNMLYTTCLRRTSQEHCTDRQPFGGTRIFFWGGGASREQNVILRGQKSKNLPKWLILAIFFLLTGGKWEERASDDGGGGKYPHPPPPHAATADRIWWKPPYFWNLERSIHDVLTKEQSGTLFWSD